MRLGNYATPLLWIFLMVFISTSIALVCFECKSTADPNCGSYFSPKYEWHTNCTEEETTCALQRQDPAKGEQYFAILRGCYADGQLPGLNSSLGCRYWTNPQDGYEALYCFCNYDFCNEGATVTFHSLVLGSTCLVAAILSGNGPL